MMQFARYSGHEPELLALFKIIESNTLDNEAEISRYIGSVVDWISSLDQGSATYPESIRRGLMILSRLYFWGGRADQTILKIFEEKKEIVKSFGDSYTLQELSHCIGLSNYKRINGNSLHFSEIERADLSGKRFSEFLNSSERFLIYTPALSGFYSILENIVNAEVFALAHNKKLVVNTNGEWWPYPISFQELFGGVFLSDRVKDRLYKDKESKPLRFDVMRAGFARLCTIDPAYVCKTKTAAYKVIKGTLRNQSALTDSDFRQISESGVLYTRAGDKLVFEAIRIPDTILIADINQMLTKVPRVYLISDDYSRAQSISKTFEHENVINLTERMFSGYYNSVANPTLDRKDIASFDDIRAMITNYLILSNARLSASCPSTNIVNSAHWSNENINLANWKSVPIHKYLVL